MRHSFHRLRYLVLAWLLLPIVGHAGPFGALDRAMMPGKVIEGHAKYENECEKCHSAFDKDNQNDLCLDCHKEVRADVQKKTGYHGRIRDIEQQQCKVCHTEHKGRTARVVLLDVATFNHDQTDYELHDSHQRVGCGGCHATNKKHREAPSKCVDCHEKDDPHKAKLGKRCDICHKESKWQTFFFDHSKTEFALKGKHVGVKCETCHVNERYKGIPTKCAECHINDDKHEGHYGKKCESCHAENGWAGIKFDHDKDTKYKLEAKHKQVTCGQCHKGDDIYKENLKTDCYSCHKLKDDHKGRYGQKCHTCHTPKGWTEIKFNHDKETKYPLKGKHKKVECVDCHPGDMYKDKAPKDCYSCHRQNDPHKGQEGKSCHKCHTPDGWIKEVDFDHDLTKFPLLGAHATISCEECHTTTSFQDAKVECATCHAGDDVHKRKQGPHCGRCHNSTDWKVWIFDHDKDTKFKLDGTHKKVHCDACHKDPVKDTIKLAKDCYSCHAKDDIHTGTYGRACERCHNTESFKQFSRDSG
mgnify:CR=1 FL=1